MTLIVAAGLAVLLVGVGLAASAEDNGVTATFNPDNPNGENGFYTSPVTISFSSAQGDPCEDPVIYNGPAGDPVEVKGTCTPQDPNSSPYTGTFTFKYDAGGPTLDDHADIVRAAGNRFSIVVDYSQPAATDNLDGSPSVQCNPAPGATLAVGVHTVNCSAKDTAGNTTTNSFTITVDGAPTVNVPGDGTEEATSHAGANVSFSVSANDAEDNADPDVSCTPSSPHTFPLGTTTVECDATDSAGNTGLASFTVTVRDTTAPEFGPAPNVTKEGNVLGGYQGDAYTPPTATDLVDGGVPPDCEPGPGAKFALGNREVTCTAIDTRNNMATKKFTVTVTDRTEPVFLVEPQDVTVQAKNVNTGTPATNGCIQRFLDAPTARDEVDGNRPVTHDAPDQFPVGDTKVIFTASDKSGNDETEEAVVSVKIGPQGACTIDASAPRNVRNVTVREDNRLVVLRWLNPAARDFWRVEIQRSRTDGQGATRTFRTRREVLRDDEVWNGIEYRYVIYSVDFAGNRPNGVERRATPHRILLLRPRDGAVISRPPLFDWVRKARARYYNLQLHRMVNGELRKVLSRWPSASSYRLTRTWRFQGHRYRLVRGRYYWYVWPGFGPRSQANYGELMGANSFRVRRR